MLTVVTIMQIRLNLVISYVMAKRLMRLLT